MNAGAEERGPWPDYRRLEFAEAAKELGYTLQEVQVMVEARVLPVCNASSKPRIPIAEAHRILKERFTTMTVTKEAA